MFYCFIKVLKEFTFCLTSFVICLLLLIFTHKCSLPSAVKVGSGADGKEGRGTQARFCFQSPYPAPGRHWESGGQGERQRLCQGTSEGRVGQCSVRMSQGHLPCWT